MFGNNPIRPIQKGDGNELYIQEIFRTFQGEGPYVGQLAIFIRLGGCNLACSFCDTEFESFEKYKIEDVINEVTSLSDVAKLVVITGGEPFRQPIEKLCDKLLDKGYKIQIETNGTLYRNIDERVDIICSPKNTGNGYHKIREDLLERLTAIKFIISANDELYNEVFDVGQSKYNIPVYVQPMDEQDEAKNKANMDLAVKLVLEKNLILSLQTHKIAGVS